MDNQEKNPTLSPGMQAAPHIAPLDPKGAARRRFTRIGAGATGVILTLHSQPGMAASNAVCTSPSGFMSMTTASRSPQASCSYNRSHGYWKNHPEEWKLRAGINPEAKFGKVFRATGRYQDLADVTLMEVIDPTHAIKEIDRHNVAMQTVAALLNARAASYAGVPSVLPEERVMEIWSEFAAKGYYTPSSGAFIWSGPQVADYLESTLR